ncbi:alpha-protein kinase 3 isoform X2 [Eublepharis macularius]|uniref:non-specific serine/threonine protein kinase n=1 Tax=Eublepharis macularius TaxID=481883 RepID=A0AA97LJ47_EUBMA|nr:alpha-protein kinase 3 isoform X2 [Eublepharis macularius]
MGSRRRPLGRSYSGNGRFSAYSPAGPGSDGEDNGPLVESRPERRSYLLSVRPENRSTFCTIIAQLTEETQPLFETTLKSYSVSEEADAKFTCIVTGYPQPEVTWYKDDEEMDRYCGLPKYEIFRHGNRHTLQLYNCREDDAAIYQASARNSKGIVSCSGVLEVGTMTEYKIHQRWFAKLKRKAEAKLREIEQSRKRGKENVEVEQLRRVSPDRFQRKRRLTGEVGMRSGTSLWDKEEVAKVHVPDLKARFNEDSHAKNKEPSLDTAALFSNNFITRPLDVEVTTNGDSSLESGEENGEENANGFLTYIYETVEIITSKPTNKESAAKKKKKEEKAIDLLNAKQDISQQTRMQLKRTIATQKNATPTVAPERTPSAVTNGELIETESKQVPSQILRNSAPLYSNTDVYFSLKDMYFDIGAKLKTEEEAPKENVEGTDTYHLAMDVSSVEETLPVWTRAVPEEMSTEPQAEEEAEGNDVRETKITSTAAAETAEESNVELTRPPKWTSESTPEVECSLHVTEIPGKNGSETELQTPSRASEAGLTERNEGETFEENIRETDLLDSLPIDVEAALQPQDTVGPHVDSLSQEAAGNSQQASLEEQLRSEGPCEVAKNSKPAFFTTYNTPQLPDAGMVKETNQIAGYLTLREESPIEPETKWPKERSSPSPEIQEPSVVVVSQEGNQYSPGTSSNPPTLSLDVTQPSGEEHLLLEEEVETYAPVFGRDENQHRLSPNHGSKETATAGFLPQRADLETRPIRCLDQSVPQTEAATSGKQEEAFELLRDDGPDLKMDLGLEEERMVSARPLLIPEAPLEPPVHCQDVLEKPPSSPPVAIPRVFHGPQAPSPVKDDLTERSQSVASLLRDVKRDLDSWQPVRTAPSEPAQQVDRMSIEGSHIKESLSTPQMDEEDQQKALSLGQKLEMSVREGERTASSTPLAQDSPQPETAMEEDEIPDKKQQKNLVTSLKNYLLLLLKMTSESDKSKESPKQETKAVEERTPPTALPRHVTDVGIAGLTPRTSRKIFERVENNQLFQSAESLQLTPKTSRRLTGMINQELLACQESLVAESKVAPPLPCVPAIVVGGVSVEPTGPPGLPPEVSSEGPAALPSATPQELALGARRKIFLPKAKQADEMEGVAPEGQTLTKKDSPAVSPQQSRRNAALLQTPVPAPSPPVERRSPSLARKMATLEVPKIYEETTEESKNVTDHAVGVPEKREEAPPEGQTGESRKANDPFKAPQVIRKIRAEQFSDASGNLKLWCQFFNILSDSKLTWYKDEIPVTETRRSSGDEGQAALAIVQVSLRDCGVYQCTIQNEYGTDSTDYLLSAEVLSGYISKEEIEAGEEIEMTPMVFAKGLADSGFWGDKFFGRIMVEDLEVGQGFLRKACRARAIYGLEPVFESGHTGIIKIRNLIAFGGRSENTLMERNYDITIQECKIQNSSREYCKIFAAEARAIPAFGAVPEIIPVYLIYRPANNIPYATMEEDLPGLFERYCGRERDGSLAAASASEVGHKCCAFQHWLYQWTNGNILVTDLEGVGWKVTNVRIATKTKGYQGLKDSCCPALLEHFVASHQCNRYCELLALKSLETPQPPAKGKGSRSPIASRKAPSAQSSPQLQKKGLSSPQPPRRGSVSPKSTRKCPEVAESQPLVRPKAGDNGKAGQLQ